MANASVLDRSLATDVLMLDLNPKTSNESEWIARNCSIRFRNQCLHRPVHFRLWPGHGNDTHSSQGLLALVVMIVVLILLILYCCWGTCCKLLARRRRPRNPSLHSCSSYTNVVVLPYRGLVYDLADSNRRPRCLLKHSAAAQLPPPPPYDVLFAGQSANPPTYSSVCLASVETADPEPSSAPDSTRTEVTVAVERSPPTPAPQPASGRVVRSSSVPSSIGGSQPVVPHPLVNYET